MGNEPRQGKGDRCRVPAVHGAGSRVIAQTMKKGSSLRAYRVKPVEAVDAHKRGLVLGTKCLDHAGKGRHRRFQRRLSFKARQLIAELQDAGGTSIELGCRRSKQERSSDQGHNIKA